MLDSTVIAAAIAGVATVAAAIVAAYISHKKEAEPAVKGLKSLGGVVAVSEPEFGAASAAMPNSGGDEQEGAFDTLIHEAERLADIQNEQANRIFATLYKTAGDGRWISCEEVAATLYGRAATAGEAANLQRAIDVLLRNGQLPGIARDGDQMRITEQYYTLKLKQRVEEKEQIACAALRHVEPGQAVILDAGSTTLRIAELLAERVADGRLSDICVITNSPVHLNALLDAANRRGLIDGEGGLRLYMLGGRVRVLTRAAVGDGCHEEIDAVLKRLVRKLGRPTLCFAGTNGVDVEHGFTTQTKLEADTKRSFLDAAEKKYIVTDPVKFGKTWEEKFADASDDLTLLTCAPAQGRQSFDAIVRNLTRAGVRVEVEHLPEVDRA